MLPSSLTLEEYLPGEYLLLDRGFFAWQLIPRVFVGVFMVPFVMGPLILLGATLTGEIPLESESAGPVGALLIMVLFFGFWYGFLSFFLYMAGGFFGEFSTLALDQRKGILTATFSGWMIYGWKTYTINLMDVQSMEVEVYGDPDDLLTLSFDFHSTSPRGERESFTVSLCVEELDETREALALVYAVANICGQKRKRITHSDHLETRVKLTGGTIGSDWEEIPEVDSDLSFKEPRTGSGSRETPTAAPEALDEIREPEMDIPPFDPGSFKVALHRFLDYDFEWNPGRLVRFKQSCLGTKWRLAAALGLGVLSGAVLTMFLGGILSGFVSLVGLEVSWWNWSLVIAVIVGATTWIRLGRIYGERELVLDWENESLTVQTPEHSFEKPLDSIRKLLLEGFYKMRDNRSNKYFCRIWFKLGDTREHFVTGAEQNDRDRAYKQTAALADDLAESLDIPWEWEGYEMYGGIQRVFQLGRRP